MEVPVPLLNDSHIYYALFFRHFDYSIPYSFGLSFICEGFGSLLYHICPSQIIFQFDTLFMFVITIIMIIGIFEGNSIRENDIK